MRREDREGQYSVELINWKVTVNTTPLILIHSKPHLILLPWIQFWGSRSEMKGRVELYDKRRRKEKNNLVNI